jgi:exopolysaccharide biosynthesis polyprenyl glycosylphosphotransferase
VASLAILILAFPIMIVAALAVMLESDGPVFFKQERVGYKGRPFNILKFRSMRVDAEADGKARWAQKNDARVTRVGKFMRVTRIDELPQVFNVLLGSMSLVGPRPERPVFVDQLTAQVPYYQARHSVKPGVTGWAQIRHHYGASVEDAAGKLEYDLYYVKNHTLFFDLYILACSAQVVITGKGAR